MFDITRLFSETDISRRTGLVNIKHIREAIQSKQRKNITKIFVISKAYLLLHNIIHY